MSKTPSKQSLIPAWLGALIILILGAVAYHNSLKAGFLFDDNRLALQDMFQTGFSSFFQNFIPPDDYMLTLRPVIYATLSFNYALGGMNPFGYHLMNLVIHLLAGVTLFGILRQTFLSPSFQKHFQEKANHLALIIALIWMVHPLQTQSVTYMVQRCESLMGLFYLLTLYTLIRSAKSEHENFWKLLSWGAFALGLGSKEVVATAPFVMLLYDRIYLARSWGGILRKRQGYYLGLLIYLGFFLYHVFAPGDASVTKPSVGFALEDFTAVDYAKSQPGVLLHYLKLVFWPEPLIFDYRWPVAENVFSIMLSSAVIFILIGALLVSLKKHAAMAFWGFWFFMILAPTSSFFPIRDLAMEHRMYLPLAGVLTLLICFIHLLLYKKKASLLYVTLMGGFLFITVTGFTFLTVQRNEVYANEITLWQDVLMHRPENGRAHINLGMAFADAGDRDKAAFHYEKAMLFEPQNPKSYNNMGNLLAKEKKGSEAVPYFKKALELDPYFAQAHNNYANLLAYQGKYHEAITHYETALSINPRYRRAQGNLKKVREVLAQ